MAGDAGLAFIALAVLIMLGKKAPVTNGNGITITPYRRRRLYETRIPETPEEAEVLTQEMIRIKKIVVHRTVVDVPTIPTVTQIESARIRIKAIDEKIPKWVKQRWGTTQAVQTPGWIPKGEV